MRYQRLMSPACGLRNHSPSLIFSAIKIAIRYGFVEVRHQLFERHDRLARQWSGTWIFSGRNPSLSYASGEDVFFRHIQPAVRLWRDDFGDDAVAVGDKHHFAGRGEADVIAELFFEVFQVD
jgi:hypothetical protein